MADNSSRKSYSEVMRIPSFIDRYRYLRLFGKVGNDTFGWDRYLNQVLYKSKEWRDFRNKVIVRDNGCDLAHSDRPIIGGKILIHHINPLTVEDLESHNPVIFDMDNVICVSNDTHQAIHYGDDNLLAKDPIIRRPNDTCPWK